MKRSTLFLLAAAMLASHQANAGDTCTWRDGTPPINITRVIPGVMHAPINAKPGDVIGRPAPREHTSSIPYAQLHCFNDGSVLWRFDMNASTPIFPDPLPVEDEPSDGHILKTNIEGVGARIRLFRPFDGSVQTYFTPEGGPRNPLIPFRSTMQADNAVGGFPLGGLHNQVTLIKTGDIAPGLHQVDTELFTGHFNGPGMGQVLHYRLQASVLQTQCSLVGNPVSADPVELGDWDKADFPAKGTTTSKVRFDITLSKCTTDAGGLTRATIELEGAEGSAAVPGIDGVFTLTDDSGAQGVGIQILRDDDSPLALGQEVDLKAIQDGTTVLNFGARFYQIEDAIAVRPGTAKGALNFTIRYR